MDLAYFMVLLTLLLLLARALALQVYYYCRTVERASQKDRTSHSLLKGTRPTQGNTVSYKPLMWYIAIRTEVELRRAFQMLLETCDQG